MMNRSRLIDRLDKITDRAASMAHHSGLPMQVSKKSVMIGSVIVEKNKNGTYDVSTFDKSVICEDISVFDVAVIIAQRYSQNETSVIRQVLALEEKYSKHHNDMVHYLHCMKSAKKIQDLDRMAILEDKFQLAEQRAKDVRDSISVFKRVK